MLRWIAILILSTALGSLSTPVSAAPGLPPRVPDWATSFLSAWYHSFNGQDASGVAALFSENARLGETTGRAEIQKTLAAEFEKTQRQCQGDFDGFKVLGDLAVGWGHETCVERNVGKAIRTKERWLLVFEMTAPGQWLLTRETYQAIDKR
jgi:ketosteroid isomerase-like protein